ncbi:MAG: MFS transporter [Anaerolineales bacterium]|nr:MFS transporter [Anaerolineales bacterium]
MSIVRRLTLILLAGQAVSSAAYLASTTVGALAVLELSGRHELSGLGGFVYMLGGAGSAYVAAHLMERIGRRRGLAAGFLLGVVGAALSGLSIIAGQLLPYLVGYLLLGAARGITEQSRYAAAEMVTTAARGRAISSVVVGGTFGAILGPSLVAPLGDLARSFGLNPLAGPWFLSATVFAATAVMLFAFLRPDPADIGRQLRADRGPEQETATAAGPARSWGQLLAEPSVQAALGALILGQLVMVMVMAMTSVHLHDHGGGLGEISLVITAHTLGMFGPSIFSGNLVDRWGRVPMILVGSVLLIAACALAPASLDTTILAFALLLLGLGWNFTYVAGAALLTDSLTLAERARGQGATEVLVNAASGLGSLAGGPLMAVGGYLLINTLGLLIALAPLALAANLWRLSRPSEPLPID